LECTFFSSLYEMVQPRHEKVFTCFNILLHLQFCLLLVLFL
jgi:hypothetical protein